MRSFSRAPALPLAAAIENVRDAAAMLRAAKHPLLMIGRVSRDPEAWKARVALAERLNARVVTDLKVGAALFLISGQLAVFWPARRASHIPASVASRPA